MLVAEFTTAIRSADAHSIRSITPLLQNVVFDDEDETFEFHWDDGDDLSEIHIPRSNIQDAYYGDDGAICVVDADGDLLQIDCFTLTRNKPLTGSEPAKESAPLPDSPVSIVDRTAYAMAASSHLAFDHLSLYETDMFLGYLAFKEAAQADPDGDLFPDQISAWPQFQDETIGEILNRIEHSAGVLKNAFRTLLEATKEGIVQAAVHDNFPQDMNELDIELIADRGFEHQENQSLLAELAELVEIETDQRRALTDKQQRRYVELYRALTQRDVEVPFGVEI